MVIALLACLVDFFFSFFFGLSGSVWGVQDRGVVHLKEVGIISRVVASFVQNIIFERMEYYTRVWVSAMGLYLTPPGESAGPRRLDSISPPLSAIPTIINQKVSRTELNYDINNTIERVSKNLHTVV